MLEEVEKDRKEEEEERGRQVGDDRDWETQRWTEPQGRTGRESLLQESSVMSLQMSLTAEPRDPAANTKCDTDMNPVYFTALPTSSC